MQSTGTAVSDPYEIDELSLVRAATEGDTGAFETLYRRHVGRVYALCLRLTADPSEAEDATQAAFMRAWQKLHTFRGASSFGTWLHRLSTNLVWSRLRSRSRHRAHLVGSDDGFEPRTVADRTDRARKTDLEAAIAALPQGARTIFVLYDIEGYRHDEIAAITGLAVGTSKAQLHRARRLLREALER